MALYARDGPFNMRRLLPVTLSCFVLTLASCEAPASQATPEQSESPPLSIIAKSDLDQRLLVYHAQDPAHLWSQATPDELWSGVVHGEGIVSLQINKHAHKTITALVSSGRVSITADYPELSRQDLLVADAQTFEQLRLTPGVTQLEPAAYPDPGETHYSSGGGLGCVSTPDAINPADYSWTAPGARVPWNFTRHLIQEAWRQSSGQGVTVGLIDTGSSDYQPAFSERGFTSGWSSGRFIERRGTFVDSIWPWKKRTDGPHDRCAHGTYMSSVLAAPRASQGMPAGVAYGANLVVYRGSKDVFLNSYHERRGVAQAILELADRQDVKIISMSMGYLFSVRNIADAIRHAHRKGKMVVAAAGTSFEATNGVGVIFPANMSETVGVTGLLDTATIKACVDCHYGAQVDFSMVVQRQADPDRRSVSVGYRDGTMAYVGGSSAATAMVSGIAALLWSKHPDWSREQVMRKLKESTDLYPRRDPNYGYGRINAALAVE